MSLFSLRFLNVLLLITTADPGGNFVRKYKTIKFDLVGEQTATKYIKIS